MAIKVNPSAKLLGKKRGYIRLTYPWYFIPTRWLRVALRRCHSRRGSRRALY